MSSTARQNVSVPESSQSRVSTRCSTPTTPVSTSVVSQPASRRRSPTSQTYTPSASKQSRAYSPDASLALIGMRGTGLSTLAVIASSALGFRLLDADQHFFQKTGLSRAAYRSTHGISKYRDEELELTHSMLFDNPTGTVIVCGPGVMEGKGRDWVSEYAEDHPVIYIMRRFEDIQQHLRFQDAGALRALIQRTGPTYRKLSAFEFFNFSEATTEPLAGNRSPKSLTLKHVEEDFLHLIHRIAERSDPRTAFQASNSLSMLPLESRGFTYALTIPLTALESVSSKLRLVDTMADALDISISLRELRSRNDRFDDAVADEISQQIWASRRHLRLPLIYHVHVDIPCSWRGKAAGEHHIEQDEYFEILHHGLRFAPEYLCVDLECDEARISHLISSKGTTKTIGCYTNPNNDSLGWESLQLWDIISRAKRLGCDIVKICQEATSIVDNFSVQHFLSQVRRSEKHNIPIIAYNTGNLGRMSRFLNPILSPVTHSIVRSEAPDCFTSKLLTVEEAQSALFASLYLDKQYFGIYGSNVALSLSPAMHNAAFKLGGMPHRYTIFAHPSLNELRGLIKDPEFGGASITSPFKQEVIPLVDFMSREARAIGAINTLIPLRAPDISSLLRDRNRAGPTAALFGENTDWIGIHACVRRNLSPINAVKRRTTGLVVGAGGMARAAVYALIRLGVRHIFVHNRTVSKAKSLVEHFQGQVYASETSGEDREGSDDSGGSSKTPDRPSSSHTSHTLEIIPSKEDEWPKNHRNPPTIIVSCIATQETDGQCSADTSLPSSWLASPTGGVVIELSYTPLQTPLLLQVGSMSEQGWITVDGLQVLPEQGMMQFELFTTRRAPQRLMREEVLKAYTRRISLGSKS